MVIETTDFDISAIAESGQCFRITKAHDSDKKTYDVIYRDKYVRVSEEGYDEGTGLYKILFDCEKNEYENVWRHYFDMDTDYARIVRMADKNDSFLNNAITYGRGIRMLNQDPFEMLISFIISQRKSIPAIRTSIERLSRLCGKRIDTKQGEYYSFPEAASIAALSEEEMASCGLGYRSAYIRRAATMQAFGDMNVYEWTRLSDGELKEKLMSLYGVGIKVADCVMLFGYHRLDAFPEDVWIKRAMAEAYPEGFPFDKYKGCSGIMQQYIFFYYRNNKVKQK